MLDGFHDGEPCHAASCDEIHLAAFKSGVFTRGVPINKENPKWGVDGEMVHELGGSSASRIRQRAARTGTAHSLDEGVHFGPVIAKAQAMESTIGVQVPADWIGVKGNEDDIVQSLWDDLKPSV